MVYVSHLNPEPTRNKSKYCFIFAQVHIYDLFSPHTSESTLLNCFPWTLIIILCSHFYTYFSIFLNLCVLLYFTISRIWHQYKFCFSPSVVGPLIVGVQPCAMSFSTWGTRWASGKSITCLLVFALLSRLCTVMKTSSFLTAAKSLLPSGNRLRVCDISKW